MTMTSYNDIMPERHRILAQMKVLQNQMDAYKKQLAALDAPLLQVLAAQSNWDNPMAHAKKQLEAFHKKNDPK